MTLLEVEHLRFRRGSGEQSFSVELPRLVLDKGEMLAVTGESGSGKSTVLELLGLVAKPDRGARFDLQRADGSRSDIASLWRSRSQRELARIRACCIGFVLQTGGLLPYLCVRENLMLNRRLLGLPTNDGALDEIVERLDIGDLLHKKPGQLSIGQNQRASIGRALAHSPDLLLADEPTSALDPGLSDQVMALLVDLVHLYGVTAVIATHEQDRVRALGLRELKARPRAPADGFGSVFLREDGNPAPAGEDFADTKCPTDNGA